MGLLCVAWSCWSCSACTYQLLSWCATQGMYHQAILGDLNTMAHGIARFSPHFCTDKMRFWSLGQSEAAFWDRAVFNIIDSNCHPDQDSNIGPGASQAHRDQHTATPAGLHSHVDFRFSRNILLSGYQSPVERQFDIPTKCMASSVCQVADWWVQTQLLVHVSMAVATRSCATSTMRACQGTLAISMPCDCNKESKQSFGTYHNYAM